MGGKAARIKGHAFERAVAKDIRKVFGMSSDEIKRGLQSRNNQDKVPDVICPGFSIECKRYAKNPPIGKAFKQAKEVAGKKIPVAITKADHEDALATIPYTLFIVFLTEFVERYGNKLDDIIAMAIAVTATELKTKDDKGKTDT